MEELKLTKSFGELSIDMPKKNASPSKKKRKPESSSSESSSSSEESPSTIDSPILLPIRSAKELTADPALYCKVDTTNDVPNADIAGLEKRDVSLSDKGKKPTVVSSSESRSDSEESVTNTILAGMLKNSDFPSKNVKEPTADSALDSKMDSTNDVPNIDITGLEERNVFLFKRGEEPTVVSSSQSRSDSEESVANTFLAGLLKKTDSPSKNVRELTADSALNSKMDSTNEVPNTDVAGLEERNVFLFKRGEEPTVVSSSQSRSDSAESVANTILAGLLKKNDSPSKSVKELTADSALNSKMDSTNKVPNTDVTGSEKRKVFLFKKGEKPTVVSSSQSRSDSAESVATTGRARTAHKNLQKPRYFSFGPSKMTTRSQTAQVPHASVNTGDQVTQTSKASKPLREFIQFRKKTMASQRSCQNKDFLKNEYEKAESCGNLIRKGTGIIYDDAMKLHECPWDPKYAENPNRYTGVMDRCRQLGLIERCIELPYMLASKEQITTLHSDNLYEKLQQICMKAVPDEMEKDAACYDSIYFNEVTFNAAVLSAGCALSLVKAVCERTVQNGMAIIRPPGHHAMADEYCGYCYFNNVAIAAKYALDNSLAKKILIVDVDVHHGQATQRMFYEDNRVLYFSIHRYEHGNFWPNLRESNFDYIGKGIGNGFNINFPLNAIGLEDCDYLNIVTHILLPVAYEFQPDLIIISAGYDACVGCTEGEMEITPGFYGHLVTLLSGLAHSKIAVCLEGGYFIPSLAEGAAMTLKALLGDPLAMLEPLTQPHETIVETINNLKRVLHDYWKCFQVFDLHEHDQPEQDYHTALIKYVGTPLQPPYPTRNCYPQHPEEYTQKLMQLMAELKNEYNLLSKNQSVSCSYDVAMLGHQSKNFNFVESPKRVMVTYELFKQWNLDSRCINIEPKDRDFSAVMSVHKDTYIREILNQNFEKLIKGNKNDMFYSSGTLGAIKKAVECLLAVVDSVFTDMTQSGVAIIRPPGHHAETDQPLGFCYVNNIAIAAQYIIDTYKLSRVLIIDFDIHHGNGTQSIFYNDNKVLFLSIHRHDPEKFFPFSPEGGCDYDGEGAGKGFNVNIGLSTEKLHNIDYISIFHRIVLPIAYSFAPEVVLVSAGFDAGINDNLGHCAVTPECFGHFIQMLRPLANGKIILALEGGYNPTTVKYSMNICIKTLLGDPLPLLDFEPDKVNPICHNTINQVIDIHKQFWPALNVDKKLSARGPTSGIGDGDSSMVQPGQVRKMGRLARKLANYDTQPTEEKKANESGEGNNELEDSGLTSEMEKIEIPSEDSTTCYVD